MTTLILRAETKPNEQRTPLTPKLAKKLISQGLKVQVERSTDRIFKSSEYEEVGCSLIPAGSWEQAPKEHWILGLKELPTANTPLVHRHIYFAHAYKGQTGAKSLLQRYKKGGGELYDLEYLTNENGRRIAAFGRWAGFVGAALAVDLYCHRQLEGVAKYPALTPFKSQKELIDQLNTKLSQVFQKPRGIVIGYLGRCGQGAAEVFAKTNLELTGWDSNNTRRGGPFPGIMEHELFINCILLNKKIPPFLDKKILKENKNLSVICDVSCDPTGPFNPLPFYDKTTDHNHPNQKIRIGEKPIDLIAIDNLPSLLPRESSEDYAEQLFPHIEDLLLKQRFAPVWTGAQNIFKEHLAKV